MNATIHYFFSTKINLWTENINNFLFRFDILSDLFSKEYRMGHKMTHFGLRGLVGLRVLMLLINCSRTGPGYDNKDNVCMCCSPLGRRV